MEQQVQQQIDEEARPQAKPGRGGATRFQPGVSGNPLGAASYKLRLAAEVAALTIDFHNVHNRDPSHVELTSITNASRLQLRLRRPQSAENMAKVMNARRRLLKDLGLDRPLRARATNGSYGGDLLKRHNNERT